ncbi:hypothetical protein RRG08_050865 [Elysia crispata]|uniref:Alpha-2-macroglobulin bait region domain-containing protein n=1 Tax=Elysia crispata TaxID=231223 RepID=A0AAE0ZDA7_9GAST|nr:hypothetical protein RRG08_050865 [Elysia crispata]
MAMLEQGTLPVEWVKCCTILYARDSIPKGRKYFRKRIKNYVKNGYQKNKKLRKWKSYKKKYQTSSEMGHWLIQVQRLIWLLHFVNIASSTKFVATFPMHPYTDINITATVKAIGVSTPGENVTLTYRKADDTSFIFNWKELYFNFDKEQTWDVVFPRKRIQEDGVAFWIGNISRKLDFFTDYSIFIQTDKPMYRPGEIARYRIVAVDEYQILSKYPIHVAIKEPGNIIFQRMKYTAEMSFSGLTFQLPLRATEGIWSISANIGGKSGKSSKVKTVQFEVREYVLPRFSAELKISTDVITPQTNWVTFSISGRYVFNRPLQGKVEMQLGVWDPDSGVHFLPHSYKAELKSGKTRAKFRLIRVFPSDQEFPKDKRLYVSVNVTEDGTGENVTIVDTSVFLSHTSYMIDFDAADKHFKPGFSYTLKGQIRSVSGLPRSISKRDLNVEIYLEDKNGHEIKTIRLYKNTNEEGRFLETFDVSFDTDKMEIWVGLLDWDRHAFISNMYYPTKLKTLTNQYVHVSLDDDPFNRLSVGQYQVMFSPAPRSEFRRTYITVQILSKGQVLRTTSFPRYPRGSYYGYLPKSLVPLSQGVTVLAYHYATLGNKSEFIVDSLHVQPTTECDEEIKLKVNCRDVWNKMTFEPKHQLNLYLKGKPYSIVRLLAVDEAALLLNDKQDLTRKSFVQEVKPHGQGKWEGDGDYFGTKSKNPGLQYLFYDTEHAHYTSLPGISYSGRVKKIGNNTEKNRCPHLPHTQRRENKRNVAEPFKDRKYFPESWLHEEVQLNRNGWANIERVLPDSLTTWNLVAVSLSPDRGVCVSKPLRLHVQKLLFADVRLPSKVKRLEEVEVKVVIFNYHRSSKRVQVVVKGVDGIRLRSDNSLTGFEDQQTFSATVPSSGKVTRVDKMVAPKRNGLFILRVDVQEMPSKKQRDVVHTLVWVTG